MLISSPFPEPHSVNNYLLESYTDTALCIFSGYISVTTVLYNNIYLVFSRIQMQASIRNMTVNQVILFEYCSVGYNLREQKDE